MDSLEAIMTRRSIRRFTDEEVSEQDLETILRAGMQAPSAYNRQPWHFVVLGDKQSFAQITAFHPYAKMLPQANRCIVVCGDKTEQPTGGFLIADCAAAIQNMLLACHALGLGAVWCGLYPITALISGIREVLKLPEEIVPVGMIVLGHCGEEKAAEDRFEPTRIHHGKW